MAEQLSGWFKSVYFLEVLALGVLALSVSVLTGRKARLQRAWKRLVRVIDGEIKTEKKISTLNGKYHGLPVFARVSVQAAETPPSVYIVVPAGPGGQDWEIAHRSEKLLGPETWRAFSKDPALHDRLEGARVPERLQGWPTSTTVRYEARRGVLSLEEEFTAPSAEHFRAQLDALETMRKVNREMNAG